jgi:hypothetical protein
MALIVQEVNVRYLKPEGLLTRDPRMVERKKSVRRKLKISILETLLPVLSTYSRLTELIFKTMLLLPH